MLSIENLHVAYGGLHALRDVSITVGEGQFIAIVGPNGAGKTTLFKTIVGTVRPVSGRITFAGQDLLAVPPAARAHLGLAHVPEGRQVFKSLTVLENLEMGAHTQRGRADWKRTLEYIYALFPVLAERRTQLAGTLSGGEQQMVALGRGLASRPRVLLLDEPSMGLAPTTADLIFACIEALHREAKLTILLVEQRVAEALQACDHGYVLESGRLVLDGPPASLLADERVKRAYLGL